MKQHWQRLSARLDGLEPYQRRMVLFGILVLMYALWDAVLMTPLEARRVALASELGELRTGLQGIEARTRVLAAQRSDDPDAALRREKGALSIRLRALDEQLSLLTRSLVPPERMALAIETVLTRDTPLSLVRLEGLGSEPVMAGDMPGDPPGQGAGKPAQRPVLYRHGLRLVFEGAYLETLAYLRTLEELNWNFLWERLSLRIREHPTAVVTLEVYTLSLNEVWIGV